MALRPLCCSEARHLGMSRRGAGWLPGTMTHPATRDGSVRHEETAYARASTYDDPTEDPVSTARVVCLSVREYIQAGIAGAHIEDQTFPPKSGPRRRCISIQEMVGKLRAAMDAKQALDPDFVIMARCDLGGVPGASFAEIIERCQAYKAEAQVDVICPNG